MKTFADALANILLSKARSRMVTEVVVSRTSNRATINYRDSNRSLRRSEFGAPGASELGLQVAATLGQETLRQVANDVIAMVEESLQ